MERLTERTCDGYRLDKISEAAERLGRFEDAYCAQAARYEAATAELVTLRAAGKTKSARFRELLAIKLNAGYFLSTLKVHGVE